jgi:hypothetical protein
MRFRVLHLHLFIPVLRRFVINTAGRQAVVVEALVGDIDAQITSLDDVGRTDGISSVDYLAR